MSPFTLVLSLVKPFLKTKTPENVEEINNIFRKRLYEFVNDEFMKDARYYPTHNIAVVTDCVVDQYDALLQKGTPAEDAYGMVLGAYHQRDEQVSVLRVLAIFLSYGFVFNGLEQGSFLRVLTARFGGMTLAEMDESWEKCADPGLETVAYLSNVRHVVGDLHHVRVDPTYRIEEWMVTIPILKDVITHMNPIEYPSTSRIGILWRTVAHFHRLGVNTRGLGVILEQSGRTGLMALEELARKDLVTDVVMETFVSGPKLLLEDLKEILIPSLVAHKDRGTRVLPAIGNNRNRVKSLMERARLEGKQPQKTEDVSDEDTEIRPAPNFALSSETNEPVTSSS